MGTRIGIVLGLLWLTVVGAGGSSRLAHALTLYPGDILVTDPRGSGVTGIIVRVDPETGVQDIVAEGGNLVNPYWIVVDPQGDLLVSDISSVGRIIRIDRKTGAQTVVSEGQFFGSPYGMAFGSNGQLFVTERGAVNRPTQRIVQVDPTTGVQTLLPRSSSGGAFVDVAGIAAAPSGDLFVVETNAGRVIKVDPATGKQVVVSQAGHLVAPRGIVAEPDGKLLVADQDAFGARGGIIEIDPTTGTQTVISSDRQFNNPHTLAIEATDALIVVDAGTRVADRVLRVNRVTGAVTTVSSSGHFVQPWGVAIVGAGPCGNGTLDPEEQCDDGNARSGDCCSRRCQIEPPGLSCIEHRLRELSDIVATRVQSAPFAESLRTALGHTLPAVRRAKASIDNDKTRAAIKQLGKTLQVLRKFTRKLDSRAGRRLDPDTGALLHDKAEAIRVDVLTLRDSLK